MVLDMNKTNTAQTHLTPKIKTHACEIANITPLSANTFQIDLKSITNEGLEYQAGHYLKLELDVNKDGKPLSLSYSIADDFTPETPNSLQLFIQNTSDFVDKVLKTLSEKHTHKEHVNIELPFGNSHLQTDLNQPHLLVAAGSGIAKIKALTEAILKQKPETNLTLYWSNRKIEDFYLLDTFETLAEKHKNLTFTPILEAENTNWSGRTGYIFEIIQEDFANLENTKAYLCGSPNMVYGTIDKLEAIGLKEKNCCSDVFEYAPR